LLTRFGRGNYQEKHKSAFASGEIEEPTKIDLSLFVVFDYPTSDKSNEYESRYLLINELIPCDHPFILSCLVLFAYKRYFDYFQVTAACCKCHTSDGSFKLLESITRENGEGIMLRAVKSEYVHGRSEALLKCKVIYKIAVNLSKQLQILRDLDALVVELNTEAAVCHLQLYALFAITNVY
jgi:hypothetical protein